MSNGYVVLFIRGQAGDVKDVLNSLQACKIKHKVVDLCEKIELYGNKVTLEGSFAVDFSQSGGMKVPITPMVAADGKIFSGSEEIKKNIGYLQKHYSDE
jgi:hypothetical protein